MRRARVQVLERRFAGLVVLEYEGRLALWSRVKLRKPHGCAVSGEPLPVGALAYRPLGNQAYRYVRIKATLIDPPEPVTGGAQP